MAHPDFVLRPDELDRMKPIEPVYPLTAGLAPRIVQKAVAAALDGAPALPEWIDRGLLERRGWPSWHDALNHVHGPSAPADLLPTDAGARAPRL